MGGGILGVGWEGWSDETSYPGGNKDFVEGAQREVHACSEAMKLQILEVSAETFVFRVDGLRME